MPSLPLQKSTTGQNAYHENPRSSTLRRPLIAGILYPTKPKPRRSTKSLLKRLEEKLFSSL